MAFWSMKRPNMESVRFTWFLSDPRTSRGLTWRIRAKYENCTEIW